MGNIHKQKGSVSRGMETIRVIWKMPEILKTYNRDTYRMPLAGKLIGKLNTAEDRISKLEDRSTETTQTETEREKETNRTEAPKLSCV